MCCDLLLAVDQSIFYSSVSKSFKLVTPSQTLLTGSLANTIHAGVDLNLSTYKNIHFKNEKVNLEIVASKSSRDSQVTCQSLHWKFSENKNLIDCFNLNGSFWYGGSEMSDQQFWPINNQVRHQTIFLHFRLLIKSFDILIGYQFIRALCRRCLH